MEKYRQFADGGLGARLQGYQGYFNLGLHGWEISGRISGRDARLS